MFFMLEKYCAFKFLNVFKLFIKNYQTKIEFFYHKISINWKKRFILLISYKY
jgi:hypothetical protein